jgi:hypothetical protein
VRFHGVTEDAEGCPFVSVQDVSEDREVFMFRAGTGTELEGVCLRVVWCKS